VGTDTEFSSNHSNRPASLLELQVPSQNDRVVFYFWSSTYPALSLGTLQSSNRPLTEPHPFLLRYSRENADNSFFEDAR
jgi:hypothetical protein